MGMISGGNWGYKLLLCVIAGWIRRMVLVRLSFGSLTVCSTFWEFIRLTYSSTLFIIVCRYYHNHLMLMFRLHEVYIILL